MTLLIIAIAFVTAYMVASAVGASTLVSIMVALLIATAVWIFSDQILRLIPFLKSDKIRGGAILQQQATSDTRVDQAAARFRVRWPDAARLSWPPA